MAKVILHIGTHKTATTTIQDTLFKNRAILEKHNIIYPNIGKANGHHSLVTKWVNLPPIYQVPGGADAAWRQLEKYQSSTGTVFLSSEEFSRGHPSSRVDFNHVKALLSGFENVKVVCVLRDQASFMQSVYLEICKKHQPQPWTKFVSNSLANGYVAGLYLDYNQLLDHLSESFSSKDMRFIPFDVATRRSGGVLATMLKEMTSDLDVNDLEKVNNGSSNRSPEALTYWAANLVSHPKHPTDELKGLAEAALRSEFGEKKTSLYTRALLTDVENYFRPLNEKLAERVGNGFRLSVNNLPKDCVYFEDIRNSFWAKFARSLYQTGSLGRD